MDKDGYWIVDQPQPAADLTNESAAVWSCSNQQSDIDQGSDLGPSDHYRTASMTDVNHHRKMGAKHPHSAKLLILQDK
jgi:hypothetical protein